MTEKPIANPKLKPFVSIRMGWLTAMAADALTPRRPTMAVSTYIVRICPSSSIKLGMTRLKISALAGMLRSRIFNCLRVVVIVIQVFAPLEVLDEFAFRI